MLQSGVKSLQGKQEISNQNALNQQKINQIIDNYEKTIAAYQLDKEAYLREQATPAETQAYKEAIEKLSLLTEEKRQKKEILLKELEDTKVKEAALNDYQKLVKNIIDSNLALKKQVSDKEKKLESEKKKIKSNYEKEFKSAYTELLEKTQKESLKNLNKAKKDIEAQAKNDYLTLLNKEKARLAEMVKSVEVQKRLEFEEVENKYKTQVLNLQSEKQLSKKAEAQLKEQMSLLLKEKEVKIADLEKSYGSKFTDLSKKQNELMGQVKSLEFAHGKVSAELKSFNDKENLIKELVKNLKTNFAKNGVEADVNSKTGEVTLKFLQVYFDQGKSNLKDEMKVMLSKFMPAYTNALFSVPNASEKIDSIEIIGFASPTFDKKYIDPKSIKPNQLPAVSYNLDLSYKRAKSIFEFIYDTKKMKYDFQNNAFSISKVSGRSFLDGKEVVGNEVERKLASTSPLTTEEYCLKYDCQSQQKVVIKFYLKP